MIMVAVVVFSVAAVAVLAGSVAMQVAANFDEYRTTMVAVDTTRRLLAEGKHCHHTKINQPWKAAYLVDPTITCLLGAPSRDLLPRRYGYKACL